MSLGNLLMMSGAEMPATFPTARQRSTKPGEHLPGAPLMRASREAALAALRSPFPVASMSPGTGRYRHHYAAHGAAFWGDDLAAAADRFFTARPDLNGSRVLDLGAGTGRHCFEAARRGAATVDAVELDAVAGQLILEGSLPALLGGGREYVTPKQDQVKGLSLYATASGRLYVNAGPPDAWLGSTRCPPGTAPSRAMTGTR